MSGTDTITPSALLRRRRAVFAAVRANRGVHVSSAEDPDGSLSKEQLIAVDADLPDTDVGQAKVLGLPVYVSSSGKKRIAAPRDANGIGRVEARLDMRFKLARQIAFEPVPLGQPEEAVRRVIEGGRVVTIPSLLSRFAQGVVKLTVGRPLDGLLVDTVHGFRPGRSPETALYHARHFTRRGHHFAIEFDIRRFFPSTRLELVAETLARRAPFFSQGLQNIVLFELRPPIIDRTGSVERKIPVPERLSAGMTIVPLLANLVADAHLDRPLAGRFGDSARMIRYADDCLLLGNSESAVLEALALCDESLGRIGLRRHPNKGTRGEVVDLSADRIDFLGYEIGRGEVRLSFTRHEEWMQRIVAAEDDGTRLRLAHGYRRQLIFDRNRRVQRSLARLGSRSPGAALSLQRALGARAGPGGSWTAGWRRW